MNQTINATIMQFQNITANASLKTVSILQGMTDIDVIFKYCRNYNFFIIAMISLTLLLLLGKATLHRLIKKGGRTHLQPLYAHVDSAVDTILIMFCVCILGIYVVGWIGTL